MALIYLVRHGKAAASFTDDIDPGLDKLGNSQAELVCESLLKNMPLDILSSPLLRAQETAAPFARKTGLDVNIENRVSEIPSPDLSLQERGAWLGSVMEGLWSEQSDSLKTWRGDLAKCLLSIKSDTVIFSHFVAINAAVSLAENADQVLMFRPDNCSVTIIETDGHSLQLIQRGQDAQTKVN
ncbi:MAG: broad specificity phosphatase PhoE [Candidatus Azotimanducaceae bacterium]|jgi:broad specificity phosphatase PhoE